MKIVELMPFFNREFDEEMKEIYMNLLVTNLLLDKKAKTKEEAKMLLGEYINLLTDCLKRLELILNYRQVKNANQILISLQQSPLK